MVLAKEDALHRPLDLQNFNYKCPELRVRIVFAFTFFNPEKIKILGMQELRRFHLQNSDRSSLKKKITEGLILAFWCFPTSPIGIFK